MRHRQTAGLLLIALVLASCSVETINPVIAGQGPATAVDAAPYLGTWTVTEVTGGTPNQAPMVVLALDGDDILLTMSQGDLDSESRVLLAEVNGTTIASIESDDATWQLLALELSTDQQSMVVREMSLQVLEQDITNGTLQGERISADSEDLLLEIQASSADLATYLASAPEAFGPVFAELEKN